MAAQSAGDASSVLRLDNGLLYLDRYWREEVQVCDDLLARLARPAPEVDTAALDAGVLRVFPDAGYDEQRTAARAAAERWTTVLTGGPGTGKTTTVAGLLALLAEQPELESGGARRLRIALTAPTGKASARLQESVDAETRALPAADRARLGELQASTLHRLLGWRPDCSTRFRHDRGNRLPHDVVVVDETSMVSLTMMARLLEAVRPDARLVLVGDPGQLASVEAGAVLADLVDGFGRRRRLSGDGAHHRAPVRRRHRRARGGAARRRRRPGGRGPALGWRRRAGRPVRRARDGGVPGDGHRGRARRTSRGGGGRRPSARSTRSTGTGCCAPTARAPTASAGWNRQVERLVADRTGVTHYDEWYAGRPVLVTANDYGQGLYNGDLGVTVRLVDGRLRVVVPGADGLKEFATTRMAGVQTVHAMTVHKSQGSQAREVSVVMPPDDSPLLTHELFYTAVTRAQDKVRVIGTEESVRAAVARTVQRASGLARRLG